MVTNEPKITFTDYYRLRHMIEVEGGKPTSNITKFNKEEISYADAYDLISTIATNLVQYTDSYGDLAITSINHLVVALLKNEVITEEQVINIKDSIKKKWQEENNG